MLLDSTQEQHIQILLIYKGTCVTVWCACLNVAYVYQVSLPSHSLGTIHFELLLLLLLLNSFSYCLGLADMVGRAGSQPRESACLPFSKCWDCKARVTVPNSLAWLLGINPHTAQQALSQLRQLSGPNWYCFCLSVYQAMLKVRRVETCCKPLLTFLSISVYKTYYLIPVVSRFRCVWVRTLWFPVTNTDSQWPGPRTALSLDGAHIRQEVSFSTTEWNSSEILETWAQHQSSPWLGKEAFPL